VMNIVIIGEIATCGGAWLPTTLAITSALQSKLTCIAFVKLLIFWSTTDSVTM